MFSSETRWRNRNSSRRSQSLHTSDITCSTLIMCTSRGLSSRRAARVWARSCTRARFTWHTRADYHPHNVTRIATRRSHASSVLPFPTAPVMHSTSCVTPHKRRRGLLSPCLPAVALDALTGCPRWSSRPRSRRSRPSRSSPWRRRRGSGSRRRRHRPDHRASAPR